MSQVSVQSKLQFKFYRMSTVMKSFKTLYTLPPEKIDAFLNSYNIYDHDWVNEDQLIKDMGKDYYKEIQRKLVDYYSVLNHLCAIGQVEKMYIPPAIDLSKSIITNQTLFERKMAQDLGIKKGNKVLDIGCGRGRVANHVASHTGANVTGMNIDTTQLESARRFAAGNGLSNQCHFQKGDMNDIPYPFADNSFDAIYQIQAFSLSKDLGKLFKEIYRMLKPGAKFACLDWVTLSKYDEKNPYHADLMKRIKPLIGAIGSPSSEQYVNLMKEAGFEILIDENASIDGLQAPLIENADKFYTRAAKWINFLVKCKILPAHFKALFDRLTKDGEAFVEADRLRLVTTSYYIVGQKKA
ncbi:MAG: methyltransferase domain-containing protein [Chlamydiae bacterium]|nr:methyltransferase domain-containing protein [Chlamydiota bacterium]